MEPDWNCIDALLEIALGKTKGNLSQLAIRCHVDRSTITRYQKHEGTPNRNKLDAIARFALGSGFDFDKFCGSRKVKPSGVEFEGLQLIDIHFLEEQERMSGRDFNPEGFYSAIPHVQWHGVARGYAYELPLVETIVNRIHESISGVCPIVAYLSGAGGMGKSTTARVIATRVAHRYQVYWLSKGDCEDLMADDDWQQKLVDSEGQALIFIDDWTHFDPDHQRKLQSFFDRIHGRGIENVSFAITARHPRSPEIPLYLFGGSPFFNLEDMDNWERVNTGILRKVESQIADNAWKSAIGEMLSTGNDLEHANPFHLMFIVSRMKAQNLGLGLAKSGSQGRIHSIFREIVESDLRGLMSHDKYRGLGLALITTAHLYLKYGTYIGQESFLALVRSHLKDPSYWERLFQDTELKDWKTVKFYLTLSPSPFRSEVAEVLTFRHDTLAEAIVGVDDLNYLHFREAEKHEVDTIMTRGSASSASRLLYSLSVRGSMFQRETLRGYFHTLLEKEVDHFAYFNLVTHPSNVLGFQSEEIDKICRKASLFESLGPDSYVFILKRFKNRPERAALVERYLDLQLKRNNSGQRFLHQTVSTALPLVRDRDRQNELALDFLEAERKRALAGEKPIFEIVCAVLPLVRDRDKQNDLALTFLEAERKRALAGEKPIFEIVCAALPLVREKDFQYKFAQSFFNFQNIPNWSYGVIISFLPPELSQPFAIRRLNEKKTAIKETRVILACIQAVQNSELGNSIIEKYLRRSIGSVPYWHSVYQCLPKKTLWRNEVRRILRAWLDHGEIWQSGHRILLSRCLDHNQHRPDDLTHICEAILHDWRHEFLYEVMREGKFTIWHILKSLAHPSLEDLARAKAKEMLEFEPEYEGWRGKHLFTWAERILEKGEFPEWHSRTCRCLEFLARD